MPLMCTQSTQQSELVLQNLINQIENINLELALIVKTFRLKCFCSYSPNILKTLQNVFILEIDVG